MSNNLAFPLEAASELLDVLSNESRLVVIELLLAGEWDVGSLATEVGLSQSALSQHLKKLRDAKMVSSRREAQTIYYSCQSDAARKVLKTLHQIFVANAEASEPRRASAGG